MRRAVVTGLGVVSPFGVGVKPFWDGLSNGQSAIRPIRSFDASGLSQQFAGEVPVDRVSAEWLRREAQSLGVSREVLSTEQTSTVDACERSGALQDRKVAFGLLASLEAWRQADATAHSNETALVIALGLEQALLADFGPFVSSRSAEPLDWTGVVASRSPFVRYRSRVDLGLDWIRALLRLGGPSAAHTSACAAGALSVAHAASLVERGSAEIVLCGGADSMVNPLGLGGMLRLGAPSPRNAADACRPFDRRRDGLVIGEGAAMFVVEEETHARSRGANPLARISGWGSTADAFKVTAPRPDGASSSRAMVKALTRAKLPPEAIGYINAHGTGTPLNDPAEVLAIRGALGAHAERVAVSSIKGAIGHCMAASGSIELAACVLSLQSNILPGTAHLEEIAKECDLDIIGTVPRSKRVDAVLSNSFGFGGQNATVLLTRADA